MNSQKRGNKQSSTDKRRASYKDLNLLSSNGLVNSITESNFVNKVLSCFLEGITGIHLNRSQIQINFNWLNC